MNKETFEYTTASPLTGEEVSTNWTIVDKKSITAVRDGAEVEVRREKRSWHIYLNGQHQGSNSNYAGAVESASLILYYETAVDKEGIIFETGYQRDKRGAPTGTDFRDPERRFSGQIQSVHHRWARGGILYRVHLTELDGRIDRPENRGKLGRAECGTYIYAKLQAHKFLEAAVRNKQQQAAA